eukprot:3619792-Amphidinium_carterae.1
MWGMLCFVFHTEAAAKGKDAPATKGDSKPDTPVAKPKVTHGRKSSSSSSELLHGLVSRCWMTCQSRTRKRRPAWSQWQDRLWLCTRAVESELGYLSIMAM